jgi:2-dehydropantoate 2-reductase
VRAAAEEGRAVLAAAGLPYASREEERARRGDQVNPTEIGGIARSGGSSWQSLAKESGTIESDYLNGEIVLLGRLHGVPTPVNAVFQRLAARFAHDRRPPGSLPVAALTAAIDAEPPAR